MSSFDCVINTESVVCPHCNKNIPSSNKDMHIPRCQKFKRPSENNDRIKSESSGNKNSKAISNTTNNDIIQNKVVIPLLDDSMNSENSDNHNNSDHDVVYINNTDASNSKNQTVQQTIKDEKIQWPCVVCTYLNDMSTNICGACNTVMAGSDTIPPDTDVGTSSSSAVEPRHNATNNLYWKCDTCTYAENPRRAHHCEMCAGERPGDDAYVDQLIPSLGSAGATPAYHSTYLGLGQEQRPATRSMRQTFLNPASTASATHDSNSRNDYDDVWNDPYDSDAELKRAIRESQIISGTGEWNSTARSSYNSSSVGGDGALEEGSVLQGMALGGLAGVGLSLLGSTGTSNRSGSVIGQLVQNAALGAVAGAVGGMIYDDVTRSGGDCGSRARGYEADRSRLRDGNLNGSGTRDEMDRILRRQRERRVDIGAGNGVNTNSFQEWGAPARRRMRRDPFDPVGVLMAETMYQMTTGGRGRGRRFDIDGMSYEQLLDRFEPGTSAAPAGRHLIDALPEQKFHARSVTSGDRTDTTDDIEIIQMKTESAEAKCVVCLSDFEEGDTIKSLPCLHRFHSKCIDQWLKRSGDCPICKHKI